MINIKKISLIIVFLLALPQLAPALLPDASIETLVQECATSTSADAYARLGWAYLLANQFTASGGAFNQALIYDSHQIDAQEGEALVAILSGDSGEALASILALVKDHPYDSRSQVYLYYGYQLLEELGGWETFSGLLDKLLTSDLDANLRQQILLIQRQLAMRQGNKELLQSLTKELNLVTDWQVVGPFANINKAGHNTSYPPEQFPLDLTAVYGGKEGPVSWRRIPFPLLDGVLPFDSLLYPQEECTAYALTAVYSPVEQTAAMRLGSSGAIKVWLNGEQVWDNNFYRRHNIDQDVLAVNLASGWNLLLIKVGNVNEGSWRVSVRFTALDGASLSGLSCSADPKDLFRAELTKPIKASEERLSEINYGARQYYQKLIEAGDSDPMNYIYLAMLEQVYGSQETTADYAGGLTRTAESLSPGWALPYYFQGLYDVNKDRGREALEMALFLSPEIVPASTELGIYYLGLNRQEKAWDIFRKIAEDNPGAIRARQYLAKISYENSWYEPMRRYISEMEKLNPEYYYLYLDKGLLAEHRGSLTEEESAYRELLKMDFSSGERSKLSQILADEGKLDEAVNLIKEGISLFPYDLQRRMELVKLYEGAEMHAEAKATATEILSISPNHWEALTWRGFAQQRLGETEVALADFRRVVELRHSYPWLSQYIEYLTPQEEDYYTPHQLKLSDILNANTDYSSYAGEIAVYLLDQEVCRVLPNGSASYTVHKVIKLLSDEAVPSFTSMSIGYSPTNDEVKIRSARVILPNGEELNATQIEDVSVSSEEARLYYDILSKVVTMPGLRSGAIIDFEYSVESKGKNIYSDYFGEQFYFGNYHPTVLSEYVLILPPQRKFYFHYVNKETPAEVLTTPDAVTYVYKWDNLPGIVAEPSMPSLANILPILQVSTFSSWEETGNWYGNLIKDQFVATDRVKQKVSELTANKKTQMDKVKALYDFVVSQIRYVGLEFGIGGYLPHKAEDVLLASYGDCKDKGTLLITMLREIGVDADVVLLRTRDLGELDYAQPMLGLFNHFIALAHTSEGDIFLDSTAEFHAYDQLPFDDQGVKVFVISSSGCEFITTPMKAAENNFINVDMRLNLADDGSASGIRYLAYGDYFAPGQRSRYLNTARRLDQLAEYWNSIYGGTVVSDPQFSNLAVLEEPVVFSYNLSIPRLVRQEGNTYYLPSRIPVDNLVSSLASNSLREYPLELNAPYVVNSSIEYQLPADARWGVNLPESFILQSDFGSFSVEYNYSPSAVQIQTDITINVYRVEPTDYARFRSFLAECDRREELEIPYVLAK